ncbi:MAG: hypothetical protein ACRESC_08920 [Gammaproteobacteria bacterium]
MHRMTTLGWLIVGLFAVIPLSRADTGSREIAAAVLPLPAVLRDAATVVRLDDAGQPHVLRKGNNGMVCITDRPGDTHFDVRCYMDSFMPLIYRAHGLMHQGKENETQAEMMAEITAEIKAGKLKLPDHPTAGYRCYGPASGYDPATNSVSPPVYCWQSIHFPFRTAQEIGLPEESQLTDSQKINTPYVMLSGTYWAHVMILHPSPK